MEASLFFYRFKPREYSVKPIVPSANPLIEAPHEKKFKKNVDSIQWATIKKGRMIPKSIRKIPRLRRKRGDFTSILYLSFRHCQAST